MQNLRNLYNQALTTIGHAPNVTDPNAEDKATVMCRLWFDTARLAVFTAFHWPSVRATRRLSRMKTRAEADWVDGDPDPGFMYTYALPADCIQPQFMADFSRFKLGRAADAKVLFSNAEAPILHYTRECQAPELWEADLYRAVVFSLAAHINTAHNGKLQLTQKLEQRVFEIIEIAATASANEDDTYFESIPTSWAETGFAYPRSTSQFFYPTSTFQVSGPAL